MKLVINYDFFNEVKNVKESYGVLKVVRNNNMRYIKQIPMWGLIDYALIQNIPSASLILLFQYMLMISGDMLADKACGIDTYATFASKKLKKLVSDLEELNVKTNYDLLLQSKLYDKRYKIDFNNDNLPIIKHEKYLYVPSYNFDGKIKDTSILQEHMLGSGNYVLSVGEPEKKYNKILVKV